MENASAPDEYLAEDLEEAYLRALAANEAAEVVIETEDHIEESTALDTEGEGAFPAGDADSFEKEADQERPAERRVDVRRVVEAALFVGAESLTTKKLARLFGGDVDGEFVEQAINELNDEYAEENRPYEIRFGEGGYRMALQPEFEKVRNRMYGLGPKEVRLSQDALEILALVAYFQPITKQGVEERGRRSAGTTIRQLLRRELISLQRDPDRPKHVTYCTTPRFLSVFGLGEIDELPRAEDLDFK